MRRGFPAAGDEEALSNAAAEAAQALLDHAPRCRLVSITLGAHGSLVASREERFRHKGFAVEVEDTVGAGDAFTAGMVHAYLRGASLERIGEVSNLCGSYVASRQGATPEFPSALLERIRLLAGG